MSLSTRKIGQDDVPELGFGVMRLMSMLSEGHSDEERLKLLDAVFEAGCTLWDTADRYGDNEELLGKWFKRSGKRDQVFLATKFGTILDVTTRQFGVNNDPEYMRASLEKSLRLMGTDRIDLYYAHRVDPDVPIEKTIRAMAELVKEGKVRYLGLSEVSAQTLRRAHAVHPIAAVQVEYSPFALDIEQNGLLHACKELGVAVVAYSPLGRGMLTGAIQKYSDLPENDMRRQIPKYSEENFPKILDIIETLNVIGKKHNATAGQVTLAWVLAQGPEIIPIPGTKSVKYFQENIGAVKVKLTAEEVAKIRETVENAELGDYARYPQAFNTYLYADTVEESK